jgi:hypothetical protein
MRSLAWLQQIYRAGKILTLKQKPSGGCHSVGDLMLHGVLDALFWVIRLLVFYHKIIKLLRRIALFSVRPVKLNVTHLTHRHAVIYAVPKFRVFMKTIEMVCL